jgi:acyl carrier protein
MTRQEFLLEMDDILELPPGSLKGPEKLEELEQWNSTAMIGFIALADTNSGVRISPRQIVTCSTVGDLLSLARVDGAAS